jgi:predicted permease
MTGPARRDFSLPDAPSRVDSSVDEEFRFHLEERRAQLIAEGMSEADAEREVQRRFGDLDAYRRETAAIDRRRFRSRQRAGFFSTLLRETKRAIRLLTHDRGFVTMTTGTLALGLGAVMAVFAVVDAVLLRPLPYPDPARIVAVRHPATVPGSGERIWGLSVGGYVHLREHARTLAQLGIYRTFSSTVQHADGAEVVRVASATHDAMGALGARPVLGRLLDAADNRPGAPAVVVLSAEYHQSRFGGAADVVGTTLLTDDGPHEIVGVANPGLTVPLPGPFADASDLTGFGVDVWMPLAVNEAGPFYNSHPFVGVARLATDASAESAAAELSTLLARFPEWMPLAYSEKFVEQYNFRIAATPLHAAVVGTQVPRVLWLLLASVLLVLTAAVANVLNLVLARLEARRHEAAIRSALGASGGQLAAHYAAESLLITGVALGLGLLLAFGATAAVPYIAPRDIPRILDVRLTTVTVGLGVALSVLVAATLAVVPMLRRGVDMEALRHGSRTPSASPRRQLARRLLVVAQLTATMVLLTGAAMLARGARELRASDPGFDPAGVLAFEVWLPFSRYDTRERAAQFYRGLETALRALPGVTSVGFGPVPLADFGTGCSVVFREGRPLDVGEQAPCVSTPIALPGYFETLGIEVQGERPTWRDVDARTQGVVVTQALADRLWPDASPIGQGIGSNGPNASAWYRVVGVIPELRAEALDAPPVEAVFYPATGLVANQETDAINYLSVVLRSTETDPMAVLPSVRAAVSGLDAGVPVVSPRPLTQVVARSMGQTSFLLALIGAAATVVLVLSASGTYGVVSYLVAQRRNEIGLRMALGAPASAVVRLVVGQAVRMAAAGLLLGTAGSLLASRALSASVYTGGDVGIALLMLVAMAKLAVVFVASATPAHRATQVHPAEALRR